MNSYKIYIKKLEKHLAWGNVENWKESRYTRLSEKIFEKTGVNISNNTLKRFTGKISSYEGYEPTETTKDALARFLDFPDWDAFTKNKAKKDVRGLVKWLIVITAFFGLMISLFFIHRYSKKLSPDIHFECDTPSGNFPHTIHLRYDLSKAGKEKYFINFGRGYEGGEKELDKTKNGLSHIYYFPGYYNIKISSDAGYSKDYISHIVHDEWIGGANWHWDERDMHIEFKPFFNNALHILPVDVNKLGFDTTDIYFTNFILSKDFSFVLDSCIIETRVRLDVATDYDICRWGQITVNCEKGSLQIPFTPNGCQMWANVIIGDYESNGKVNDNSAFTFDNKGLPWLNLKIIINNGHLTTLFNKNEVYTHQNISSFGKVKEIRYKFNRSGWVDYLRMSSLYGEDVHVSEF